MSNRSKNKCAVLAAAVMAGLAVNAAKADPINLGDLLVYQVGNGSGATSDLGTQVILDDYHVSNPLSAQPTVTLVQQFVLPTSSIVTQGTATSEGQLGISANSQYVAFTGYSATTTDSKGLSDTTSAANPRVVGVLSAATGTITYTTLSNFASGNNPRTAVPTNDGTAFWAAGASGGVVYSTVGNSSHTANVLDSNANDVVNFEDLGIVNGQLVGSTQKASKAGASNTTVAGLIKVGSGTPVTAGSATESQLLFNTGTNGDYSFVNLDIPGKTGASNTIYFVDTHGSSGSVLGTLFKFEFDGSNWNLDGSTTIAGDGTDLNIEGVSGTVINGQAVLYVTAGGSTTGGGGVLDSLVDSSGTGTLTSGSLFQAANPLVSYGLTSNIALRGVVDVPEPASLSVLAIGAIGMLGRRRRKA